MLRNHLANFYIADPEVFDAASRRIPYDYQKEIIDQHFDEALRISALRCVDVEAAPGDEESQAPAGGSDDHGGAVAPADGDDERACHVADVRKTYAKEDSRLVVHPVVPHEVTQVTEEELAEFYQLYSATKDDATPMLDREGVMRCMGIGTKRHSKLSVALRDAGGDTRARGPRVKERARSALGEFSQKQAARPNSISEADAIRARFADRVSPHTGRLSTQVKDDGEVQYALTEEQKLLFRDMVEQWDSKECRMFSRSEICSCFGIDTHRFHDLMKAAACGRRQGAQNRSAAVKITERATKRKRLVVRTVEAGERAQISEEESAPFYQLHTANADAGATMIDSAGVMRCMGMDKERLFGSTAALGDAGVDTRATGPRETGREKEVMREISQEQALRPQGILVADDIRARFAARAAPHTGRLSVQETADGKVEYALTAEQKELFRDMLGQWDSTGLPMFSRDDICSMFGIDGHRYLDLLASRSASS